MANTDPSLIVPKEENTLSFSDMKMRLLGQRISDLMKSTPQGDLKPQEREGKEYAPRVYNQSLGLQEPVVGFGDVSKYDTGYSPGGNVSKETVRANNQGFLSEMFNTLVEPVLNAPFMLGQYTTAAFLPEDFKEVEKAAAYNTYKWFKDHADEVRETFPVYQTNEGGFQGAREYIMSTLQQVGESAMPFVAIGAATGGLASLAGSALGATSVSIAGPAIRAMLATKQGVDRISFLKNVVSAANYGRAGVGLGETLATAYALNHTESMVEAADNYANIYEEKVAEYTAKKQEELGVTQLPADVQEQVNEEARNKAQIGAQSTAEFNKVNLLLNITSANMFTKMKLASRNAFKSMTPKSAWKSIAVETVQESAEEVVNLLAQTYGQAVSDGDYEKGIFNYLFSNDALSTILSEEAAHSAFAGALGGGIQTGITQALTSKTAKYKKAHAEWLQTVEELDQFRTGNRQQSISSAFADMLQNSKLMQDYSKAIDEYTKQVETTGKGDMTKVNALEKHILQFQALSAFKKGAGAELQGVYESIRDMPVDEAAQLGYDTDQDSIHFYKDKASKALEDIANLEMEFNYSRTYSGSDSIYYNRAWNSYLENQIQESNDRVAVTSSVLDSRSMEIFGEPISTLEQVDQRIADLEAQKKAEVEALLADGKKAEAALKEAEFNQKINKFKKNKENFENSKEYIIHQRESNYLQQLKEGLADNNVKYDDLLRPNTQEAIKRKEEKQKEDKKKNNEKILQQAKLDDQKKASEQKRKENQNKKLADLGYPQEEIDIMSDDVKTQLINGKVRKDTKEDTGDTGEGPAVTIGEQGNNETKSDPATETKPETEKTEPAAQPIGEQGETTEVEPYSETDTVTPPKATELDTIAKKVFEDGSAAKLSPREQSILDTNSEIINSKVDDLNVIRDRDKKPTENIPAEETVPNLVPQTEIDQIFDVLQRGKSQGKIVIGKLIDGASNALAYLSRPFKTDRTGEGASVIVTKKEIQNELNNNLFLGLLDPAKFQAGTEVTMKIDSEYDGEINDPNNPTQKISWKAFSELIDPNSDQYLATVPMAIYDKAGNKIGYVHDLTWVQNEENNLKFDDPKETQDLMNLRHTIRSKGEFKTKVTSKSQGTLLREQNGNKESVATRFPKSKVAVMTPQGLTGFKSDDSTNILNEEFLVMGRSYVMAQMANGDYMAIPIDTNFLGETSTGVANMIAQSVMYFALNDAAFTRQFEEAGADISSFAGIREFASMFVYSYNFENEAKNFGEFMESLRTSDIPSNKTFFNFTSNAIEFGRPKGVTYSIYIDPAKPNVIKVKKGDKIVAEQTRGGEMNPGFISAVKSLKEELINKGMSVNARKIGQNVKIPTMSDTQGITVGFEGKYEDFVKENTQTQFMSVDVNGKEVASVQPVIRFNLGGVDTKPDTVFNVVQGDTVKNNKNKKAEIDKQNLLEKSVQDLKNKRDALRGKDGVVPKENMAEFQSVGKKIIEAQNKAQRADTAKTKSHITIKSKPKSKKENPSVLIGENAVLAEAIIEKIISKGIADGLSTSEIIQKINTRYVFDASSQQSLNSYISDRNSDAPEIGNNKQSFPSWRRGKYDAELEALEFSQPSIAETTPETKPEVTGKKGSTGLFAGVTAGKAKAPNQVTGKIQVKPVKKVESNAPTTQEFSKVTGDLYNMADKNGVFDKRFANDESTKSLGGGAIVIDSSGNVGLSDRAGNILGRMSNRYQAYLSPAFAVSGFELSEPTGIIVRKTGKVDSNGRVIERGEVEFVRNRTGVIYEAKSGIDADLISFEINISNADKAIFEKVTGQKLEDFVKSQYGKKTIEEIEGEILKKICG